LEFPAYGFTCRPPGCAPVVAALGADHQFAVAFGFGFDPNLAEAAVRSGISRFISDRVLIPDVVRHGPADFIDLIERLGKERDGSK
jgi:hypothetical protein